MGLARPQPAANKKSDSDMKAEENPTMKEEGDGNTDTKMPMAMAKVVFTKLCWRLPIGRASEV